ncbi:multidrug ABC transporter ATP-binding protein [Bacillus atrophaeus]|uniref:Antibiotic transport system ATP-binding protein n=1 Tax=Bacillus atrophaeus (strain 1942) TaxID=720555 RepID=A0ABM5M2A1_BACA1|nr:ATP-binding cassette domain-containing protein [Bacillus atrophaeus]AMR61001.1 multidrug ABC transporter ATP-binding protein [Bacillus subtilis subsp. globigii]ADP34337.1 antibiotic transport system ATP-binding protein [Bacillus atrophaeus 1942]AIK47994.1 ABC transporter family protein [Bacillus atrophaeus subsp. globigii]ARW08782.1 Sulfate/thiosulfate import ATP-binding protein CysA [Bacillus atrophaeus]EIM11338.1 antibiotic transport system ATP-binding protein [Bacillus atrophaeus C89]
MSFTIKLENVTKTLNSNMVVNNVSLQLESGNIYGFRGANGSGKSMLFRVISGLLVPEKGVITVNQSILHKDISFPESMGIVIENPEFIPHLTGKQNLKVLASIKKQATDMDINHALNVVGLDKNDSRKYKKFSLGMKQRLAIGQAIMENPDLLILDEPTNALDEATIERIKTFLDEYKKRNKLILISSHDKYFLELISDQIYEVKEGRVTISK